MFSSLGLMRAGLVTALMVGGMYAVETQFWTIDTRADYEKAKLERLALRSDGQVSLAPVLAELFDPSVSYLWAAARDSKGNVYTGGGNPGAAQSKVFVIDGAGAGRAFAEVPGLQVQAIAIDRQDRVYAATAPDGKVYRLAANAAPQVFYDPHAKYIWALAFAPNGDLYVATGEKGEIHRVTPAGAGSVFFKADDEHIRSLAVAPNGDVIAGTEPSGLILRVSPAGVGFVVHQAARREVTSVAVAADGTIYAAAVGNKSLAPPPVLPPAPVAAPAAGAAPASGANPAVAIAVRPAAPPTLTPSAVAGGSELYRIGPDGYPLRLWADAGEIVYSVVLDSHGRPLLGTGNRGSIYRVESELLSTRLANLAPTQVTALVAAPNGGVTAVTGNIGKVYRLGPELEKDGVLESDILDAGSFSTWGRIEPKLIGAAKWETRSGNVDRAQSNWSPWSEVGERITSPASRYLQYRMTLRGAGELNGLEIAYLPRNAAPLVEKIEIAPANYRFPAPSAPSTAAATLVLPAMAGSAVSISTTPSSDPGSVTLTYAKGMQGARWRAGDSNGDTLLYTVEIRGKKEKAWKLLKDKLPGRNWSWDSQAFADGEYQLRVTATDAPSNVPGQALTSQLESGWLLIDNTAPVVEQLAARANGANWTVTWTARDALSVLQRAEYSVNGGDWTLVEPINRLQDSRELRYSVSIPRVSGEETTIAVRVSDYADNVTVGKTVVQNQ